MQPPEGSLTPVRLLDDPIVLRQTTIEDVSLGSDIIPPLPLKIRNGGRALFASVDCLECTSMTSIEIRSELWESSVK